METARRRVARHSSVVAILTASLMRQLVYFTMATVAANVQDVPDRRQTGCTLPSEWRGRWFEGGIGDVTITAHAVLNKGECVDNVNDYYLLDNREIGCYTCLQVFQRHNNVLQYKESFCYGREAKSRVCDTIHPETVQRTLIRESGAAEQPCPFQGAYHFIYSNNSGGECRTPTSYVTSCASAAHLSWHFRHCADAAYTYERDVDALCLASWREAANTFAVWRMSGPGFAELDGGYRCILYRMHGNVVHLAISADASCRGLLSPTNGPVRTELTEDVFGWQPSQCKFPDWMSGAGTWRNLAGNHVYEIADEGDILRRRSATTHNNGTDEATSVKSFRCLSAEHYNRTRSLWTFVAMTMVHDHCAARYQCLTITRRADGVMHVVEGISGRHPIGECPKASKTNRSGYFLIQKNVAGAERRCPVRGRHTIFTGTANCDSHFRSACSSPDVVDIVSTCSSRPGLELVCLRTWSERSGKRYFVAALKEDGAQRLANCFSIRPKGDTLLFSTDSRCNAGVPQLLRDRVTYVMSLETLSCDSPVSIHQLGNSSSVVVRNAEGTSQKHGGSESSKHSDSSTRQSRERKAWHIANSTSGRPPSWTATAPRLFIIFLYVNANVVKRYF